jgi:hypothetical protein
MREVQGNHVRLIQKLLVMRRFLDWQEQGACSFLTFSAVEDEPCSLC